MSAPSSSPTPAAPEHAPVCCPACGDHLRAHPHAESAPLTFPCGHSTCSACADAVLLCAAPVCPVCLTPVDAATPNIALGVFAEAALSGKNVAGELAAAAGRTFLFTGPLPRDDVSTPCGPFPSPPSTASSKRRRRKRSRPNSTSTSTMPSVETVVRADCEARLSDLLLTFSAAVESMRAGLSTLSVAKTGMIAGKDASVARFSAAVDSAIAVLNSHRAAVIRAANSACDERVKALDSQADTLSVSVNQLQCAINICEAAIGTECSTTMVSAHASVSVLAPLALAFQGPAVAPVVEVARSMCSAVLDVRECVRSEKTWLIPGPPVHVVSGAPLWFVPGKVTQAKLVLALADGSHPEWLLEEIVCISVNVKSCGDGGSLSFPISCTRGESGALTLSFEVSDEGVREVEVCVSVFGEVMEGGRFVVPRVPYSCTGCVALGVFVETLPLAREAGQGAGATLQKIVGMAVSDDEKWLVVSRENEASALFVYALPGGDFVRAFGGKGRGPLHFNGVSRLVFAPNGNLIVVDKYNRRLQEVTLGGVFARFICEGGFSREGSYPNCLDVHDGVIAVGCFNYVQERNGACAGFGVELLDFETGEVTSRFGEIGSAPGQLSSLCSAIRFTPAGGSLIVAEHDNVRLSLFTTAGVFLMCVGTGVVRSFNMDMLLVSAMGEYVVIGYEDSVCVFSSESDGSKLVRSWGEGQLECPLALAISRKHVYVLDKGERVRVFE